MESSREKEGERGKNKESEEPEIRIDEAFRDTAKRVEEKGDQDSEARDKTRKRRR